MLKVNHVCLAMSVLIFSFRASLVVGGKFLRVGGTDGWGWFTAATLFNLIPELLLG